MKGYYPEETEISDIKKTNSYKTRLGEVWDEKHKMGM